MCLTILFRTAIALWFIGLMGCGASGQRFERLNVPEGKAVVYIYRIGSIVGSAGSSELFANGSHLTRVDNGGYFAHVVDPGQVEYKTLQDGTPILLTSYLLNKALAKQEPLYTLKTEAGVEYFLRWRLKMFGPTVDQVKVDQALRELNGLRMFVDRRIEKQ
jgi:Protein of unknown function (DUF2846)